MTEKFPVSCVPLMCVCVTGMTGPLVIDYKGDRIMDYQVWYLASDGDNFKRYMKIPLTRAGRNTTACVEWLVKQTRVVLYLVHVLIISVIFAASIRPVLDFNTAQAIGTSLVHTKLYLSVFKSMLRTFDFSYTLLGKL